MAKKKRSKIYLEAKELLEKENIDEVVDTEMEKEVRPKGLQLDQWQKDYIAYKGDKILVAGRQTGKSEAQAYDNAEFAATHPGTTCLLISKTQRQSEELLIKTLNFIQTFYPEKLGRGKYKTLKHVIWIMHKGQKPSRVMCLPTGLAGEGIRTFTVHKLSVDEAQLPPDAVFAAVTPMMLTTGGKLSLTGTPKGKKGFFWKAYENKTGNWKVFHVNSEEVIEKRPITLTWPEWRRIAAKKHLETEKAWMSAKQYKQEYMGEFIEDFDQVFSNDLIKKCCVLKRRETMLNGQYFLGVDVGRTIDPSTFEILDMKDEHDIEQVDSYARKEYKITETADEVLEINEKYKLQFAGIDGAGIGAGVVDILLKEDSVKRIVQDLNNASRDVAIKKFGKKQAKSKTLLKEDMYRALLIAMERGWIKLLDDDELTTSLASIQTEYTEGSQEVRYFGNKTHLAEGLIRAYRGITTRRKKVWIF